MKHLMKHLWIKMGIFTAGVVFLTGCGVKREEAVQPVIESVADSVPSPEIEDTQQGDFPQQTEEATQQTEEATQQTEEMSQQTETVSQRDDAQAPEVMEQKATIVMVGDVLLHTRVEESAQDAQGNYDFSAIFANVKDEIAAADVAIVNQEVILGGEELGVSGYPTFNGPYEVADALVDAGFDVICHATNHALDKGAKGLINCLNYWEENYPQIEVLGIHDSAEDQEEISVLTVNGIRIAICNYTYGTNGISLPSDMPYAVDLLEKERIRKDLARAEELADFTIVCPHWGTEYVLQQTQEQKDWAALFYEEGADLVLGTHPHVIEPYEMMEGENGQMLVYYSLGNFVNWTSGTGDGVAKRMVGGMAQVCLARRADGTVAVEQYDVAPLVTQVEPGYGGVTTYLLEDYTPQLAADNAIRSQAEDFSWDYIHTLVSDVWGK